MRAIWHIKDMINDIQWQGPNCSNWISLIWHNLTFWSFCVVFPLPFCTMSCCRCSFTILKCAPSKSHGASNLGATVQLLPPELGKGSREQRQLCELCVPWILKRLPLQSLHSFFGSIVTGTQLEITWMPSQQSPILQPGSECRPKNYTMMTIHGQRWTKNSRFSWKIRDTSRWGFFHVGSQL